VESLRASYGGHEVVSNVSLDLGRHECVALVGESGSGKTTLARCIVGLHRDHDGRIFYDGNPVSARAGDRSAELRRSVQYIFQSPYNSLNPRHYVGEIVAGAARHFFPLSRHDARRRAREALGRVNLSERLLDRRPGELSGGERQRVAIARALICDPTILVCDEITSALDVSIQAAIVDLLSQLQREDGLSTLFLTHNLALVRTIADRVLVLNRGVLVEAGPTHEVLESPKDPYTRALIADTPSLAATA
jgi:peptide/nickel transport system ATP-binding protein